MSAIREPSRSGFWLDGSGLVATTEEVLDDCRRVTLDGRYEADVVLRDERTVSGEPVAELTIRASELVGVEVGGDTVVRMIDEFPVLAVAATQAQGETIVRDAGELRVKETDRIATTVQELRRLGAEIEPRPDGLVVHGPTPLKGAIVQSHGDHRLAMALAVAGLIATGKTIVENVDCIADSFPGFEAALAHLGGDLW